MNAPSDRSAPPLWRPLKAPSLAEFEVMAIEAFRRLPDNFRALCSDLVIRIEDFYLSSVGDIEASRLAIQRHVIKTAYAR